MQLQPLSFLWQEIKATVCDAWQEGDWPGHLAALWRVVSGQVQPDDAILVQPPSPVTAPYTWTREQIAVISALLEQETVLLEVGGQQVPRG